MVDPDECELHEVVLFSGAYESEVLLRLAQSPIGDECQRCPVCRSAREYVERRLAERAGRVYPPDQGGAAALQNLQAAIDRAKAAIHAPT
jgi:hypothetical protein